MNEEETFKMEFTIRNSDFIITQNSIEVYHLRHGRSFLCLPPISKAMAGIIAYMIKEGAAAAGWKEGSKGEER